jgi:hypothetical protein
MLDTDINRHEQYTANNAQKQAGQITPAFQFSVLICKPSLLATKIIYPIGEPRPYDNAKQFLFEYKKIDCLEDFAKLALPWLAKERRRFIIRGQLKPGLTGWQRRLSKTDLKTGDPATIECPPRRWIVLDIDGARVPAGLGAPDKLAEAAYDIRDRMLPSYFRGVRCVASATSSTGRKGLCTAHMRLFFVLNEAVDNEILRLWITGLSEKYLAIDPKVMEPQQPIYTARPIFQPPLSDPVPVWGRVRLLDGHEDELVPGLPRVKAKKYTLNTSRICDDIPDWMVDIAEADAGCGVAPIPPATEISARAWNAIRRIFDLLDGSPKNGIGRHESLNRAAWWLARLYSEGELPEDKARDAFFKAAEGIHNGDGKYDADLLARHIDDAFADIGR